MPAEPLFSLSGGGFERDDVLTALGELAVNRPATTHLTVRSFRRGAAQHTYDRGPSKADIQALDRWTSDAVDRYYTEDTSRILRSQRKFNRRKSNESKNNTIRA
ncbi:hypothetical protein E4U52_006904 [Claviceps spartinae]|nr:hypothetical protein E4U52_006904 [Claviceps spartinae]